MVPVVGHKGRHRWGVAKIRKTFGFTFWSLNEKLRINLTVRLVRYVDKFDAKESFPQAAPLLECLIAPIRSVWSHLTVQSVISRERHPHR